jgi:hypothetical protein
MVRSIVILASCVAALALPGAAAAVTINFDTYPDGSLVPGGLTIFDQWQGWGVLFSDKANGGAVGAADNACSRSLPNHASANTIVARFVDPASGQQALTDYVGTAQDMCWVPGEGIAIRAYDIHGNQIGSVFNSGGGHFEALSFGSAIVAWAEMDCVLQGIDDFAFNTPTTVGVPGLPSSFRLERPMNPATGARLLVSFSLPSSSPARLELLDVAGRRVALREVGSLGAGAHQVRLGSDAPPSGVYFLRLIQGGSLASHRVAIVR